MRVGPRWVPVFVILIGFGTNALAQMPTYHLGRKPTEEEIRALDTISGPAGKELPPGKGSSTEGAPIYATKCAFCHGRDGEGTKAAPRLVKFEPMYPFATTLWSFINTAMPRSLSDPGMRDGTLSAEQVYALTAFLLYKNGIIQEGEVLNADTLPKIPMPTRDHRLDRWTRRDGDEEIKSK